MDTGYRPIDDRGHYIYIDTIIASGDAALVVDQNDVAIKMALAYKNYELEEAEQSRSKKSDDVFSLTSIPQWKASFIALNLLGIP